jgi:hypothetical protein
LPKRAKIIGLYDNPDFSAPIEYTLGFILSVYGQSYEVMPFSQFLSEKPNPAETLVVSYGRQYLDSGAAKQVHIYASEFFGKDYLKLDSMPETPLQTFDGLPVIYAGQGEFDGLVKKSNELIETKIDIIAASFFLLSRYEEVVLKTKDEHDRFPVKASLAYQEGFLDRPLVNEYIELLWNWIKDLSPDLERRPLWPQGKEFAVCLTHDVDSLQKYSFLPTIRNIGGLIIRQGKPLAALKLAWDYTKVLVHLKKDPFDTFDYMLELEHRYGFKSAFYFMAGGDSPFDGSYSIDNPKVRKLIQKIGGGGGEVGLHASYNSYSDLGKIASEKERLDKLINDKAYGCRQHYLRWKTPDSWRIQEAAGLLYDATLTFAEHPGFRCSVCLPFQPFDIIENRKLDIWELPLTVMEASLQNPDYQNLPPEEAGEQLIKYVNTVKRFQGVFALLWHNSSFDSLGGWAGWQEVYEKVMAYIGRQPAFVSGGREIVERWAEQQGDINITRGETSNGKQS